MHKNAIKIVGGVKFSKKIPQNVGFFVQKLWDFQHWGGDKIVGFSASRGGFSPFNFWPHSFCPVEIICIKDLYFKSFKKYFVTNIQNQKCWLLLWCFPSYAWNNRNRKVLLFWTMILKTSCSSRENIYQSSRNIWKSYLIWNQLDKEVFG